MEQVLLMFCHADAETLRPPSLVNRYTRRLQSLDLACEILLSCRFVHGAADIANQDYMFRYQQLPSDDGAGTARKDRDHIGEKHSQPINACCPGRDPSCSGEPGMRRPGGATQPF